MAIARYGDSVVNEVILPPVTMDDQGSTLTCQARNNNISTPAVTAITIDIRGWYCPYEEKYLKTFNGSWIKKE